VDAFLDFVLARDPVAVILLLMLVSALENVFPPVPADVATALGAFWAIHAGISPILIGLLCFLANQVSAFGVYFWAREKGKVLLQSPAFQALLPAEMQPVVHGHIERFGSMGVFVSRFLPGLRAGVLPFAAINGLPPVKALGPAAFASLIWYSALIVAGSAMGLAYDEVKNTVARVTGALGAVGLAIAAIGLFLLWRAGKKARTKP
jgi:membrane protein DedA with SNARE-associated domain